MNKLWLVAVMALPALAAAQTQADRDGAAEAMAAMADLIGAAAPVTAPMAEAATGAAAAKPQAPAAVAERDKLLRAAQIIGERFTDESWAKAVGVRPDTKKFWPASRRDAERLVYARLARLDYADSLQAGPAVEEKPQVQAALETVETGVRVETGWGDWVNSWTQSNQQVVYHRPTAVAAVRGGRTITADDAELAGIQSEMEQVDGSLQDSALTPEKRADLLYKRGRLFNRMAQRTQAAPATVPLSPKEIYEKDGPAVVVVVALGEDGVGELGTGSIIDASGRVLTNAHVVTRDGQPFPRIKFFLKPATITGDKRQDMRNPIAARVARFDRALDLALLEPLTPYASPATIPLGASAGVEPGEPVVAIGHPEQGGLWTLTTGVVSTTLADLDGVKGKDVFQTDASINRGNSGGPLLDRSGRLIGVNTSMARKASDGLTITSVNFSIKSAVVAQWLGTMPEATVVAEAMAAKPAAVAAPAAPAVVAKAEAPAPAPKPAAKPAPSQPQIVTPAKPYRVENVLEDQMKEMEDLEKEMQGEIERRR